MTTRKVAADLDEALAVLAAAAGQPVVLDSPPGAALSHGPAWFAALAQCVRATAPDAPVTFVLDCADAPGLALQALRLGLRRVKLTAPAAVRARLEAMGLEIEEEISQ